MIVIQILLVLIAVLSGLGSIADKEEQRRREYFKYYLSSSILFAATICAERIMDFFGI